METMSYSFYCGLNNVGLLEQLIRNPRSSSPRMGKIYEAIESLLQSVSPMYERKRRENLFAQLERWS
jgi:hypothetical protein